MDITETLESMRITNDVKARRVLNTAPDNLAGITLQEIVNGITIERLESLTVPVYQYSTQITIHGTFEDMPDNMRVCGYKSVFLNENKSLGIKYVAIDGAKKELLSHVSRLAGKESWHIHKDSQGYEAVKTFVDRDKAIECYNGTPDDLYIGGKRAVALMYGGYAVIIHIGAIHERNLWPLIEALTGISSQSDADKIESVLEAERITERAVYEAERIAEQSKRDARKKELAEQIEPLYNWIVNPTSGIYYKARVGYNGNLEYYKIEFKTRGKQLLSRKAMDRPTFAQAADATLYDSFKHHKRKDGQYRYIESKRGA